MSKTESLKGGAKAYSMTMHYASCLVCGWDSDSFDTRQQAQYCADLHNEKHHAKKRVNTPKIKKSPARKAGASSKNEAKSSVSRKKQKVRLV